MGSSETQDENANQFERMLQNKNIFNQSFRISVEAYYYHLIQKLLSFGWVAPTEPGTYVSWVS